MPKVKPFLESLKERPSAGQVRDNGLLPIDIRKKIGQILSRLHSELAFDVYIVVRQNLPHPGGGYQYGALANRLARDWNLHRPQRYHPRQGLVWAFETEGPKTTSRHILDFSFRMVGYDDLTNIYKRYIKDHHQSGNLGPGLLAGLKALERHLAPHYKKHREDLAIGQKILGALSHVEEVSLHDYANVLKPEDNQTILNTLTQIYLNHDRTTHLILYERPAHTGLLFDALIEQAIEQNLEDHTFILINTNRKNKRYWYGEPFAYHGPPGPGKKKSATKTESDNHRNAVEHLFFLRMGWPGGKDVPHNLREFTTDYQMYLAAQEDTWAQLAYLSRMLPEELNYYWRASSTRRYIITAFGLTIVLVFPFLLLTNLHKVARNRLNHQKVSIGLNGPVDYVRWRWHSDFGLRNFHFISLVATAALVGLYFFASYFIFEYTGMYSVKKWTMRLAWAFGIWAGWALVWFLWEAGRALVAELWERWSAQKAVGKR